MRRAHASTRHPTPVSMWLRAEMCLCNAMHPKLFRRSKEAMRKRGERKKTVHESASRCTRIIITRLWIGLAVTWWHSVQLHTRYGVASMLNMYQYQYRAMTWEFRCATDKSEIHSRLDHICSFRQSSFIGPTPFPPTSNGSHDNVSLFQFSRDQSSIAVVSAWALFCAPDYSCSQCDFNYTKTFSNIRCFMRPPMFVSEADKFCIFLPVGFRYETSVNIATDSEWWRSRGHRIRRFQILLIEEATRE